jgi:hypothetical protein
MLPVAAIAEIASTVDTKTQKARRGLNAATIAPLPRRGRSASAADGGRAGDPRVGEDVELVAARRRELGVAVHVDEELQAHLAQTPEAEVRDLDPRDLLVREPGPRTRSVRFASRS